MASTLQQYHQLADHMATQITGSYQSWTDFLTTAAAYINTPIWNLCSWWMEEMISLNRRRKKLMPSVISFVQNACNHVKRR